MALNHFRANHFAARHFRTLRREIDSGVLGGGGWPLWAYQKDRITPLLKREQVQFAEIAVHRAIEAAPVRDRTLDLLRAEESLIDLLNAQNAAMTDILRDLLRIEYELWLAEQEEAAIVMILFDL
jgi:hypothetical protein